VCGARPDQPSGSWAGGTDVLWSSGKCGEAWCGCGYGVWCVLGIGVFVQYICTLPDVIVGFSACWSVEGRGAVLVWKEGRGTVKGLC
jgi:hypothetical protein